MSHNTTNTTAFIEAQQYSKFILANLPDMLLPDTFYRDVSDFSSGTTLNIKTVGTVTIQDAAEGIPLNFTPIDTSTITLAITEYVGDAWYVSDELREDASQVEQLSSMRAMEATRAIAEKHETDFLVSCNSALTSASVNLVNNRPHRWVADSRADNSYVIGLSDFIAMKLAFDKANIPAAGRIAIVDPVVEATLNSLSNLVNVSNNPMFEGIVTAGFAQNHKFVKNIFGFDVWTSNRLPTLTTTEAINASAYGLTNETAPVGSVVNVFMSVADDNTRPIMHAWRRQPKTEGWRDHDNRQDKFQQTSRYGFGAQRRDSIGAIITSAVNY